MLWRNSTCAARVALRPYAASKHSLKRASPGGRTKHRYRLNTCAVAARRSANDAQVEAGVHGAAALSLPRPHAHARREKEEEGQEEIVIRFIKPHQEVLMHQSESESLDPYPDRPSRPAVVAISA